MLKLFTCNRFCENSVNYNNEMNPDAALKLTPGKSHYPAVLSGFEKLSHIYRYRYDSRENIANLLLRLLTI